MGKVVGTIGIVVAAVALTATGIGAIAAPALAGAVTIGGVSASTLLLAGTALQAIGRVLTKQPKPSGSTTERLNASLVTDTPRKMVFGRTAMNTDLRYQEWWGGEQEYCSQVFALASHHCTSLDEIWLDDKLAWTSARGVIGEFVGYLVVQSYAQASAGSVFNANWSRRWGAQATFSGCATLYLQFKVTGNGKKGKSPFTSSITSRLSVVGKGAPLPDPRFDSTAGGMGALRVSDQTTWSWAPQGYEVGRNPALALLFYLIGWRIQNPSTGEWKLAVGRGVPIDRINLDSFITAANLCDEPVMRPNGTSEPRYRCDGTFSEGDDPSQVIANFETCMNAKLRDSAGRFSLQVLHNDLATPMLDFTDDDVLGDFSWTAGNDLNDRRNVVRGRYTDPTALYQLADFPQIKLPALDGIDRIESLDLALVQSPGQAQRLAKQRVQRQQYEGEFRASFNARGWAVKDGDVVRLTFSALGFNKKLFRVSQGLIDPTGSVPLVLGEEHPSIYAWDREESPAVQAAVPNTFDPLLLPIIAAIDDAGRTAEWPVIVGEGKPDDYATNSGDPDSAFGPGTVKEAIATLDRIEPIAADTEALKAARQQLNAAVEGLRNRADVATDALAALDADIADGDAARRQIERDAGRISDAVLQLLLIANRTQETLRDAGFVVDPNNGKVRIYAVDQLAGRQNLTEQTLDAQRALINSKASSNEVDEKILRAVLSPEQVAQLEPLLARIAAVEIIQDGLRADISLKADLVELTKAVARITSSELKISAAEGLINGKVEQTAFDDALIRLGSAEIALQSYGDVSRFEVELRQARADNVETGAGLLSTVVAADDANGRMITALAGARQELYTKITGVGDAVTVEARARTELEAALGVLDARSVQDRVALVRADEVLAQDIDALGTQNERQEASIATLTKSSLTQAGGIAGIETSIRQQSRGAGQSDAALLAGIIGGDEATRRLNNSLAEIQTQLTTTLVAGFEASAVARQALRARIDQADARFVQEVTTTADRFKAVTQSLTMLDAAYGSAATGLAETNATIARLERATADQNEATIQLITDLRAVVNNPVTGLPRTRAELTVLTDAVAEQNRAAIGRFESLEAAVGDNAGGLTETIAKLDRQIELTAERDNALGIQISELAVEIHDPTTGLPVTRAAVVELGRTQISGDEALADLIQQVTARLEGIGDVGLEQSFKAVVTRLGQIEGVITWKIDVNGNVNGLQLIGGAQGPGTLNLINTDLRMGTGRVIFNNGTFMQVQGVAFGVARDLLEWFGPTMAIDQCSRANAKIYKAVDGDAYYGGSLSAGQLKNNTASSGTSTAEVAQLGPFGSNGGAVKYIASWSYRSEITRTYEPTAAGLQQYRASAAAFGASGDGYDDFGTKTVEHPPSTITLTRSMAGAAFAQIDQRSFAFETQTFAGIAPTVGDAPGRATFTTSIGGGFTVNDPSMVATDRTLRLTLARGFTIGEGNVSQRLTIVSLEE